MDKLTRSVILTLVLLCVCLSAMGRANAQLSIPLQIKNPTNIGVNSFPAHAVVPFAFGQRLDVDGLVLLNNQGTAIPAQFSVLNRWWAKDNSIRHMLVQFSATVASYNGAGTGISNYLITTGTNPSPSDPIEVITGDTTTVRNSLLNIDITQSPFAIGTPVGAIEALFTSNANLTTSTFARDDITVNVEERGPIRAVVRISAPTVTRSDGSLLHGWAMRLYAYAGSSHIKLDVQLQNAALDSQYSGPLYFDSFEVRLSGSNSMASERRAQLTTTPLNSLIPGALVSGVAGIGIRQFHETWPNGVRRLANGTLVAELFPRWSENQVLAGNDTFNNPLVPSNTGMYWLEDMQAVIKEVVIDFGTPTQQQMEALLAHVDYPPVAVLPLNYYRDTGSSVGLSGFISAQLQRPTSDDNVRTPNYSYQTRSFNIPELNGSFMLGWDEFLHDPQRKRRPSTTGGWPPLNAQFIVSGNPRDYFYAADQARGELNVSTQWLPGYSFERDQSRLQLTENPYAGTSWRRIAQGNNHLRIQYLPGTSQDNRPRDDEHGWFYHVEQSYWFTADPWIKDWYEFVAEFRKVRLNQADPFPNMQGRAVAHALNHAIQAFRVTGDLELTSLLGSYIQTELVSRLNNANAYTNYGNSDDDGNGSVASWQTGFMLRSLIDYLEELPGPLPMDRHAATAEFIDRSITWNVNIGNFSDWRGDALTTPAVSHGTGFLLVDPQLWYAWQTGRMDVQTHAESYLQNGLNGGATPFGNFTSWSGSFEGRFTPIDTMQRYPDLEVAANQWVQLSLPCNPGSSRTVEALFGDDNLGTYGVDWILWDYDSANNQYENVQEDTSLFQGVGYWFLQGTDGPRVLTLPASCTTAPVSITPSCNGPGGCFSVATSGSEVNVSVPRSWHLIGYPFSVPSTVSDTQVFAREGVCATGCSIGSDAAMELVRNTLWHFNGTDYELAVPGGSLLPWRGYWLNVNHETGNTSTTIRFANPAR